MIRLAFMTDSARVIGAREPEANMARFPLLPPGLHPVMKELYDATHVVVGAASLGPWREPTGAKVYVLSRDPDLSFEESHIEVCRDASALVERFVESDETLLVAGGKVCFELFLPYADEVAVALATQQVPGDVVFDAWDRGQFQVARTEEWEGGKTLHLVPRKHRKLDHASRLYMEGIRDGRAREAVEKYTGARYTQHSTGVADGKEGFLAFFEPFLERNPKRDIRLMRSIVDGQHVFVHAFQELNDGEARWVTMDFFDTDEDDLIIEHWDVIAPYAPNTPSGHTSVDGPGTIDDLASTEANKATVREMIEQVLMPGGDVSRIDEFIAEQYIQHNADVPDGRDAFYALAAAAERPLWYHEIVLLVGEGNFVATLCRTTWDGQEYAQTDVFRLEDGKIVEHWDAAEPVPPREEWANGGKF